MSIVRRGIKLILIYEYSEERFARKIAFNICQKKRRERNRQLQKTLVEIIEQSIPKSKQNDGHPAKRTFQAIRIEVNNEIKPLFNTSTRLYKMFKY